MLTPETRDAQSGVEEVLIRVAREHRITCTGPGEVGCAKYPGWHSRYDHDRHVAEAQAAALESLIAAERAKALREAAERWADYEFVEVAWLREWAEREQAARATETGLSRPRRSQGYPNANDVILSRESGGNEEDK